MNNDIFEIIKKWGRNRVVSLVEKSVLLCSTDLRRRRTMDVFRWKAFLIFFPTPFFVAEKNPFSLVLITGLCSFELKTSFWSLIRVMRTEKKSQPWKTCFVLKITTRAPCTWPSLEKPVALNSDVAKKKSRQRIRVKLFCDCQKAQVSKPDAVRFTFFISSLWIGYNRVLI